MTTPNAGGAESSDSAPSFHYNFAPGVYQFTVNNTVEEARFYRVPRYEYLYTTPLPTYINIDLNLTNNLDAEPEMPVKYDETHEGQDGCGDRWCGTCYKTDYARRQRRDVILRLENRWLLADRQLPLLTAKERITYDEWSLELRREQILNRARGGRLTEQERLLLTPEQLPVAVTAYNDYHRRLHDLQMQQEEARKNRAAAALKARETLESFLPDSEIKILRDHGWFHFVGPQSGRTYRINCPKDVGPVSPMIMREKYDPCSYGNVEGTFCYHVATYDLDCAMSALAVMLAIKADEGLAMATANGYLEYSHPVEKLRREAAPRKVLEYWERTGGYIPIYKGRTKTSAYDYDHARFAGRELTAIFRHDADGFTPLNIQYVDDVDDKNEQTVFILIRRQARDDILCQLQQAYDRGKIPEFWATRLKQENIIKERDSSDAAA